jgi:hypothetical protein
MLYYLISLIALLLISVTVLLRANDLGRIPGFKWHIRRLGFVLVGLAPLGIIVVGLIRHDYPNLYETLFRVGILLVLMTSPNLPPWWSWLWGEMLSKREHRPLFGGEVDRRRSDVA